MAREFCIAEADDFEKEVEALRGSRAFQRFLTSAQRARRIPLEDIEAEIEEELAKQENRLTATFASIARVIPRKFGRESYTRTMPVEIARRGAGTKFESRKAKKTPTRS
jgi:hypothetical protein